MPEITSNNVKFTYGEQSIGKNRGIMMSRGGVANDRHVYKFSPNPHNQDSWYNKNQPKFYRFAAEAIIALLTANGNAWPGNGSTITVHGFDYQLELQ